MNQRRKQQPRGITFLVLFSVVQIDLHSALTLILSQALKERDAAQRKVQELIAQHVAEVEDLKSQLAKVLYLRVKTSGCILLSF